MLDLDGVHQHREVSIDVLLGSSEPFEHFLCFIKTVLSSEKPRRLRSEEDDYHQWERPYPLDCEGDAVSPLVCTMDKAIEHAGRDELANRPAKLPSSA